MRIGTRVQIVSDIDGTHTARYADTLRKKGTSKYIGRTGVITHIFAEHPTFPVGETAESPLIFVRFDKRVDDKRRDGFWSEELRVTTARPLS